MALIAKPLRSAPARPPSTGHCYAALAVRLSTRLPVRCSVRSVIRFSIMYPRTEGAKFDHEYYLNHHVPLAMRAWGIDHCDVDRGIDGPRPGGRPFDVRVCGSPRRALSTKTSPPLSDDTPNDTDIKPVSQISEIAASPAPSATKD